MIDPPDDLVPVPTPLAPEPFQGPILKIKRAAKHINECNEMHKAWSPTRVGLELIGESEDRKQWVYTTIVENPATLEYSLALGDAIHNLRSALDLLICDVARLRGKAVSEVKFPFSADRAALDVILDKAPFRRIGADVVTAIAAERPYKTNGNVLLRGLHDLDLADKHRLLLVAHTGVQVEFTPTARTEADRLTHPKLYRPSFGGEIWGALKEMEMGIHFRPSVDVITPVFSRDLPFARKPVIPTLHALGRLVEEIVERFRTKFGKRDGDAGRTPSIR